MLVVSSHQSGFDIVACRLTQESTCQQCQLVMNGLKATACSFFLNEFVTCQKRARREKWSLIACDLNRSAEVRSSSVHCREHVTTSLKEPASCQKSWDDGTTMLAWCARQPRQLSRRALTNSRQYLSAVQRDGNRDVTGPCVDALKRLPTGTARWSGGWMRFKHRKRTNPTYSNRCSRCGSPRYKLTERDESNSCWRSVKWLCKLKLVR